MFDFENEVIEGKDGYLFLGKGAHDIINYILEKRKISRNSFVNFINNIEDRTEYCKQRNIAFKHVIYPCKHSVMKAHFPIKKYRSLIDLYIPFFTEDVIDMREVLLSSESNPYLKTDTHLNFEGKKLSVIHIFKELLKDCKDYSEIFDACKNGYIQVIGDLGGKLIPEVSEEILSIKTEWDLVKFNNRSSKGNDGLVHIVMNVTKLKKHEINRCLIFGDSFSFINLPLLSYEFSEILFLRTRYFHPEIVEMFKPDVVMTQSLERYLTYVDSDENAPRFNLLYGLKGIKYSEDKKFYTAYNAVLNYGKKTYFDFITEIINNQKA